MDGIKIRSVAVESKTCAEVLTTAVEAGRTHGIGYWASVRASHRTHNLVVELSLEDVNDLKDGDVPQRYDIDVNDVERAIGKMLRDPKGTQSTGWMARLLDDNDLDGPLADAIVQVACFGKIQYG